MDLSKMNILFVVSEDNLQAKAAADEAMAWCKKNGVTSKRICGQKWKNTYKINELLACKFTLICVFGGDGTILSAAEIAKTLMCPIVGINFGHLGFLTNSHHGNWKEIFIDAVSGNLYKEERKCLDIEVCCQDSKQGFTCLNEVSICRHQTGHVIDCDVAVNGQHVFDIQGDGIIAASSTGSTAYALSCGGPVMSPSVPGIVLCPISPHTLVSRPLITSLKDTVTVKFPHIRNISDLSITLDGKFIELKDKLIEVNVKLSEKSVCFLITEPNSFYSRVGRVFY